MDEPNEPPNSLPEVMARICWDFAYAAFPDIRIVGSSEVRTASTAIAMAAQLNKEYGDGSHWVETLNHTHEEKIAALREALTS